ncbi:MAG: cytochrome ubiquinol oxidase subunit I [Ignavibacteriae bacterium]|nr:cytochrome ubiquinol oxidase subunit I [Ignavibacteriota bacterium]
MQDAVLLSRIQFGITAGFHFLYPPMSIGLSILLIYMEWKFLKTGEKIYEQITKYFVKVFALIFGVGVATGVVMEFEFGTNWATYSRYVGDIFGSPLAIEAIFAFFLESAFLGILLFGWNKVSPRFHFFSTIMVSLGAILSAFWIIVANSWMNTPTGYKLVYNVVNGVKIERAVITDFWTMVFNPSTMERFEHVISACFLTGAFLVLSISAYWLWKKIDVEHAKKTMKMALFLAVFSSLTQLFSGHHSGIGVYKHQPAKLAAYEGHFKTAPGNLYTFGWVDEKNQKVYGVDLPGFLSYLVFFDPKEPLIGINDIPPVERPGKPPVKENPPIQVAFQSYHLMVTLGLLMIAISIIGLFYLIIGKLFKTKWLLALFIPSFILPHTANMAGWIATEVARQPWAVQNILLTREAVSNQVWFSLIMFTSIYLMLGVLFIYLMFKKIKQGPASVS